MATSIPTLPQINLGPTIGADLIGLVFAAVVLDTLSVALIAHGVYTYLITDFDNLLAMESLVWSISSEPAVTGLVALMVHLFLAYRIQVLDHNWRTFALGIALVSFFPFGNDRHSRRLHKRHRDLVLYCTREAARSSLFSYLALSVQIFNRDRLACLLPSPLDTYAVQWLAIAGDVSTSVIDLIIAASITYLLYRSRNGFASTERMLNTITLYILTSGLITTTLTTSVMISYLAAPTKLYFQMLNMSVSKAYTNTLLATLNSRRSIRDPSPSSGGTAVQLRATGGTPAGVGPSLEIGLHEDEVLTLEPCGKASRETKVSDSTWVRVPIYQGEIVG
ncbi:hypothetical protein HYDPIDRAFT_33704 [Hydnomerulius pinastri MD-312]|uniref:DUF6534 domain-containing protein n=1 Tax=Hydnomerulius pinastri MD-312 TaxID=994086 RepID=A0A0C9W7N8_9AGAM|nr:hypothetical protein HYDPIDRAFT_33704 [Hydnomerulius pinastri MD-312]